MSNSRELEDGDFSKVGDTALLVAYFREGYGNPIADEVSRITNAEKTSLKFFNGNKDKLKAALSWMSVSLEMRQNGLYSVINEFLNRTGNKNVLEVGAGVALENAALFSQDGRIKHVLTDYSPELVRAQRELVSRLIMADGNLTIRELDALSLEQTKESIKGFEGKPYVKTSAGVLPYFSLDQRRQYFDISRETMPAGSEIITIDIMTKANLEKLLRNKPDRFELLASLTGITGSQLIENAYESDEQAVGQIEQAGLKVARVVPIYYGRGYDLQSPSILAKRGIAVDPKDIESFGNRPIWVISSN